MNDQFCSAILIVLSNGCADASDHPQTALNSAELTPVKVGSKNIGTACCEIPNDDGFIVKIFTLF
jgi:hypothetical protein